MTRKKALISVAAVSLFCCAVMAVVDGIWMPGYAVKSAVKLALFLLFPYAALSL